MPVTRNRGEATPTCERPHFLYKYEPFTLRAVQNLKQHSLYFGPPSSFNDPFDCALTPRFVPLTDIEANAVAAKFVSDPETPRHIANFFYEVGMANLKDSLLAWATKEIQSQCESFSKTKGITCFSEVNDNLLMWSHYGGQHRGFCLEFNTDYEPFSKLHRVVYSTTIPEFSVSRMMVNEDYQHVLDLFCTKSSDWAYEKEWRVIHQVAGTVFTYEPAALNAVYFGAKMTEQDIDMLCLILHGQNPDVKLFHGYRSPTEYKVDFNPFTYTSLRDAKIAGMV